MSTNEENRYRPDVISRVTLRPGETVVSTVVSSTASPDLSTSPTLVTSGGTLVSAVVVHIDNNDSIRQANESLAGVERLKHENTVPNK